MNTGLVPWVRPFDPYPFTFLTLMVSLEAIFLAIFVLASQNRMTRMSEQRAHLDFQINMLAEQENTKILALLQAIAHSLGLEGKARDAKVEQLVEETDPDAL